MSRPILDAGSAARWAQLNSVELNGIEISKLPGSKGFGILAKQDVTEENAILMTVPKDLILSLNNVWLYAKSDYHLREVLEAVGDFAKTTRGAILIFLLVQLTTSDPCTEGSIGTQTPWTMYVQFLPQVYDLATFWSDEEREALRGTSLEAALAAKLNSLDRELILLRESTQHVQWCQAYWWSEDSPTSVSMHDWKIVDAMYRSRALDLPGTGNAMVPFIDMANHASGDATVAQYETDENGNGILVLWDGKKVNAGGEITITYGDEKGACEMLFSYGFIEESMENARELFLDLDIDDDDPLRFAKKATFNSAPGFRLYTSNSSITWEGSFVYLLCVNEEDGLEFRVLQLNSGEVELKVAWKSNEITGIQDLVESLLKDPLRDIFRLRALVTVSNRIGEQIDRLGREELEPNTAVKRRRIATAKKLAMLEQQLLDQAEEEFRRQKDLLLDSSTVQAWLNANNEPTIPDEGYDDDFA